MIKLSEFAPATAEAIASMLAAVFPNDHVAVITGDSTAAREFCSLPFDHLLFTGSTTVGRDVMRAAAENLTPVTLELGGKSPAILDADCALDRAAASIVYGKLLNAGQTCIGVDYVLAPRKLVDPFVEAAIAAARRFFPGAAGYTAILQARHRERLESQVAEARAAGVRIVPLAVEAASEKHMAPVILVDPPDHIQVMREEIFGPILPVKPYDQLEDAIAYVNARPHPLILYLFTKDRELIERVTHSTRSGAVCINDTLVHIVADNLPFGGVGASGMGHYHGREGFDTFSKLKPVLRRRFRGLAEILRPPYTDRHRRLLEWLLK
jgi:acyl-CoA reductase-like NAD-dependent aldehyde dehydrogenase